MQESFLARCEVGLQKDGIAKIYHPLRKLSQGTIVVHCYDIIF
jgi:hypothetical protein